MPGPQPTPNGRLDIHITAIRLHELECPVEEPFGWSLAWTDRRRVTLVEVHTDCGITGWGDGAFGHDVLMTRKERVLGRSPFEMAAIHEELRVNAGPQSRPGGFYAGALDVALWDIAGQALGKPVWTLLGKRYRERVQPYCTALYRKRWPDLDRGLADEALQWKQRGFRAMKMKIGYGPDVDTGAVRAVREAIGPEIGLAVDSNCAYDSGTAVALARRLEPLDPLWWEEPLSADDLAGYDRLRHSTSIPLAGCETLCADDIIRQYVQPRRIDIVQPEIEMIGLTGARTLSHLTWLNHMRVIPHNWGTAIRTAAILHWASTVPPVTEAIASPPQMFEWDQTEMAFRDPVIVERFALDADGAIAVPDKPGLGITVNTDAVARGRRRLTVVD